MLSSLEFLFDLGLKFCVYIANYSNFPISRLYFAKHFKLYPGFSHSRDYKFLGLAVGCFWHLCIYTFWFLRS